MKSLADKMNILGLCVCVCFLHECRLKLFVHSTRTDTSLTQLRILNKHQWKFLWATRPPEGLMQKLAAQVYTHTKHCIIHPIAACTPASVYQVAFWRTSQSAERMPPATEHIYQMTFQAQTIPLTTVIWVTNMKERWGRSHLFVP